MNERDIFESVEQARDGLVAFRDRLESGDPPTGSPTITDTLRDLDESLHKLRLQYGLLREVLDQTNDVVFAKDRDGRYVMINPRGAMVFGHAVREILGANDHAFFAHDAAEQIMAIDRDAMSTGSPRIHELVFDRHGSRKTLLMSTRPWYDRERRVCGVIGLAQDFTAHDGAPGAKTKGDDDRVSGLVGELVINEERLRRLLAAELHDGLGQDIALVKMKLAMLRESSPVEMRDPLRGIEQLIDRADRSLRSITFQISPPSLHDLGLVAALEWLREDSGKKHGIEVRLETAAAPPVADERVRTILFRAVRELIVNSAIHAHVDHVIVRVDAAGDDVRITVADTGNGFDPDDLERRGYGLFGIREQLKFIGGSMHVESAPKAGTTVTLIAPSGADDAPPTT